MQTFTVYAASNSIFIFQVNSSDLKTVAKLIRDEMETALKLKVKLPVNLKVGKKWGEMTDYQINS